MLLLPLSLLFQWVLDMLCVNVVAVSATQVISDVSFVKVAVIGYSSDVRGSGTSQRGEEMRNAD